MNCLNCTTRHLQTSGRLVQILIACIVQPGTGIPPVDWCTNSMFVLYNRSTGADINVCTVQLGTGRRPVDWCRYQLPVLYNQALAYLRSTGAQIQCLYCTTRHWQTSGRLVQISIACTVQPGICRRQFDWCRNSIYVLYNQALADVRSTSAGIRCLYCTTRHWQTSDRLVQI